MSQSQFYDAWLESELFAQFAAEARGITRAQIDLWTLYARAVAARMTH